MKIIVPKIISDKLIERIKKYSPREIKGSFYAEQIREGYFLIDDCYFSSEPGTISFVNMLINKRYRNFEENYFAKRNNEYDKYNYIGDWHSHPSFECKPSNYDLNALKEEYKNSNAYFLVQFIFKVVDNKLFGNAYICNAGKVEKVKDFIIEQ